MAAPPGTRRTALAGLVAAMAAALLAPVPGAAQEPSSGPPSPDPRVVGGEPADAEDWMVSVFLTTPARQDHYCGGTLIAPRWVLTAAHCVDGVGSAPPEARDPDNLTARIGLRDQDDLSPATIRAVESITLHPRWDRLRQRNDLALLELAEPVVDRALLATAAPAEVPRPNEAAEVLGWGATQVGGDQAQILQRADLRRIGDNVCAASYESGGIVRFDPLSMLCAGQLDGSADACQGDSGGPLLRRGDDGDRQIGIVSFGRGCADPDFPGVYTDLANQRELLRHAIGNQPVDLVVVISGTAEAEAARHALSEAIGDWSATASTLLADPRVAVVTYDAGDEGPTLAAPLGSPDGEVLAAAMDVTPGPASTGELLDAVTMAADLPLRSNAHRAVLVIGDAAPEDDESAAEVAADAAATTAANAPDGGAVRVSTAAITDEAADLAVLANASGGIHTDVAPAAAGDALRQLLDHLLDGLAIDPGGPYEGTVGRPVELQADVRDPLGQDVEVEWLLDVVGLDGPAGATTEVVVDRPASLQVPVRARTADGRVINASARLEVTEDRTRADRLGGVDRWETAAGAADLTHPDGADVVVLASGMDFADALTAGPFARRIGAPLLLTADTVLPQATAAALDRLAPDQVLVVGGTAAIGAEVTDALAARDLEIGRIAGPDRFATAARVAEVGWPEGAPEVFVATGLDFPDALAGGAAAAREEAPLLLSPGSEVGTDTRAALADLSTGSAVVLGGTAAIDTAVLGELSDLGLEVQRVSGPDRFATAARVAGLGLLPEEVWLATGLDFPDALSAAPGAAAADAPVLLVLPDALPDPVIDQLGLARPDRLVGVGGTGAITTEVLDRARVEAGHPSPR